PGPALRDLGRRRQGGQHLLQRLHGARGRAPPADAPAGFREGDAGGLFPRGIGVEESALAAEEKQRLGSGMPPALAARAARAVRSIVRAVGRSWGHVGMAAACRLARADQRASIKLVTKNKATPISTRKPAMREPQRNASRRIRSQRSWRVAL